MTCLVAQMVKRLPTMWDPRVQSLGWEDLLEKEMATHSSTLAWKIPWRKEPGRLQSMGSQRVRHDWATSMSMSMSKGRGKTSGASVVSIWPVPYTCALYSEVPQIIFNTSCFHLKSLNDFWMKVLAFSLCTGSWKLCHQLETSIIL